MKPIKLEMTAFGSYARPTSVDFQKLKHGLYLITGDTGAGKTTIFDGIMFALYGVASGEGDKKFRTFEMMHCDYVDQSEDTVIRLDFEHLGKTYSVERKFHFRKKRNTGEYEKTTPQAKLWEPDRDVQEGTDAVTNRITELLGMNAGQFRKIVMLAQGEFKKFLDADSEEKNQILGELFDNSAYVRYQNLFDRAREKLSRRRLEEGDAKIQRAMEGFLLPKDIIGEEAEVFTAGHSGLEEALDALVEKDRALQGKLTEELEACREKENGLREGLGRAETQNAKLDELAAKEERLRELRENEPDMARLNERAGRVQSAFYQVIPKQVLFQDAKKIYEDTVGIVEGLSQTWKELGEEKAEKEDQVKKRHQEHDSAVEQLGKDLAEIEKMLPRYDELTKKSREWQKENRAAGEAGEEKRQAEEKKIQITAQIEQLKSEIQKREGAEGIEATRRAESEKAKKDWNRLAGSGGIRDQVSGIRDQEADLEAKRDAFGVLLKEVSERKTVYDDTYRAFIRGQAGLLAKGLEQELSAKGEAVCPVCKTLFHRSEEHDFAEFLEGTPEQGDVDRARNAFERKDKKRQESAEALAGLEAELNKSKENLVVHFRELRPDCPGWEALAGTSYLEETVEDYERRKKTAEKAYHEAQEQSRVLKEKRGELSKKEEELEACKKRFEDCADAERKHTGESGRLEAAIGELKKNLKYPDKPEAVREQKELQREKEERAGQIREAEEAYQGVKDRYYAVSGSLDNAQKNLPGFRDKKEKAEEMLRAEVERQGFQSLDEALGLLEIVEKENPEVEDWLALKNRELQEYKNDRKNTKERIDQLKEETKNSEKVDLEQLKAQINAMKEQYEAIQKDLDTCKKQYENHCAAAQAVREANQVLKATESAWKRLDGLANLAVGVNSEGGKLSFDRYVMGYVFREVLDMANRRLDLMSGGRYELIHEISAGRNNAKAGLEISVLDMTTGKSRSASSLSGGESFFVSLSLALGLSDVVQNHAGGKRLDALFIDEGFGTLDDEVLDQALAVLNQLTEGQRLVGIISHVAKLEESIPQQIWVRKGERGSVLELRG